MRTSYIGAVAKGEVEIGSVGIEVEEEGEDTEDNPLDCIFALEERM